MIRRRYTRGRLRCEYGRAFDPGRRIHMTYAYLSKLARLRRWLACDGR